MRYEAGSHRNGILGDILPGAALHQRIILVRRGREKNHHRRNSVVLIAALPALIGLLAQHLCSLQSLRSLRNLE